MALLLACCSVLAGCGGESADSAPVTPLIPTTAAPMPTPAPSSGGGTIVVTPPPVPTTPTPAPTPTPTPSTVVYDSARPLPAAALSASHDWTEDATPERYNGALALSWRNELGSWIDAAGAAQGNRPFASALVSDTNEEKVVEWDVTDLVRQYGADFLIRRAGGTFARFRSREAATGRPELVVTKGGAATSLEPLADVHLHVSTVETQGKAGSLSSANTMLLRFNVGADPGIAKAVLRLTTYEQYGTQTLDIFRPDASPAFPAAFAAETGTAADVLLRLSGDGWKTSSFNNFRSDRMALNADGSLTMHIPTGSDTASLMGFSIPRAQRRPVMFARTVMKVHGDWDATAGGKYPGLSNTGQGDDRATQCAWGGRLANGTCWSARTAHRGTVAGTPFAETHQALSAYIYRVNRNSANGDYKWFALPIRKNKAFVLDQMVKLNSIAADGAANADGELAYWVDGVLVARITGIVWRSHSGEDTLPSEYWLNVYEGGTGYEAPHPHTVTFYEASVSTKLLPFDRSIIDRLNL
jgi:hypothetical protein